ncbi:MAG: FHA domain-containing protein [Halobacteriales archaeon]|nr:FHA domain-containing protein [Halobacteriales archaeon]
MRAETLDYQGRRAMCYVVNPVKLYALTEELRRLSVRQAGHGLVGDATGTLAGGSGPDAVEGPRLVLVHGVYEGRAYPLRSAGKAERRWVVGRARGLDVSLDYDPFVSTENCFITEEAGRFTVADVAASKNGTSVNWVPLAKGGTRVLRAADVIGVGRSLLSFAPA